MPDLPEVEAFCKRFSLPRKGSIEMLEALFELLEALFESLSDEELKNKTKEFKSRLNEGEELINLLPEAYAAVRESSRRTIKLRHYDCQVLGGVILNEGKIAEMATGEGKTLVATLPCYLRALTEKAPWLSLQMNILQKEMQSGCSLYMNSSG